MTELRLTGTIKNGNTCFGSHWDGALANRVPFTHTTKNQTFSPARRKLVLMVICVFLFRTQSIFAIHLV